MTIPNRRSLDPGTHKGAKWAVTKLLVNGCIWMELYYPHIDRDYTKLLWWSLWTNQVEWNVKKVLNIAQIRTSNSQLGGVHNCFLFASLTQSKGPGDGVRPSRVSVFLLNRFGDTTPHTGDWGYTLIWNIHVSSRPSKRHQYWHYMTCDWRHDSPKASWHNSLLAKALELAMVACEFAVWFGDRLIVSWGAAQEMARSEFTMPIPNAGGWQC